MKPLGRITVSTIIPERLTRLSDLAENFWWTWNCEAAEMFKSIDPKLWNKLGANPAALLRKVGNKKLLQKLNNEDFLKSYDNVVKKFDDYMNSSDTWFNNTCPEHSGKMTAYFSAEFGLNESLPIYSGGLGVLSGDHCKSASDLGLPFTAIGLFYRQGYFNQTINREGIQETSYSTLNISDLAIKPVFAANGENLLIGVDMPGRTVYASIWLVKVGRVKLYLLDSDVPQNSETDRRITARLYGGEGDTRIQQEILLGMGGIKALDALGIKPYVYHMNEGHSAFLGLELIRNLMQKEHLNFMEACEAVASSSVFTTHTPVPAGIDVFSHDTIDRYFTAYRESLGISREDFMALGVDTWNPYGFNMASLAMTLASARNGVSKLHGTVARRMFNSLWPGVPEDEVPVTHVTNGIHTLTWLSASLRKLYDKYFEKGWDHRLYKHEIWQGMDNIPDEELWRTHAELKANLAQYVNSRINPDGLDDSLPSSSDSDCMIDPAALTIGFSRRFATYKRASLIFRDIERIRKILNMKDMPVQLIFAGKAHPADRPGQDIIKSINDVSEKEGFTGKVILLENYNMALARRLVQGVDVWLNNPRVPMEASGTSGQKACINGVLNLSVLDGWWREGYNGKNGWAIGSDAIYENEYYQDNADSESLYDILEKNLVPLYYDRNESGLPVKWIKMMKESVKSLAAEYSTSRMVQEYTARLYMPAIVKTLDTGADGYQALRDLSQWKRSVKASWHQVSIAGKRPYSASENIPAVSGEKIDLEAIVTLGSLKPEDVCVELYFGSMDSSGRFERGEFAAMQLAEETEPGIYRYKADLVLMDGGEYGYSFRVVPCRKELADKFEMRLVKWADSCIN